MVVFNCFARAFLCCYIICHSRPMRENFFRKSIFYVFHGPNICFFEKRLFWRVFHWSQYTKNSTLFDIHELVNANIFFKDLRPGKKWLLRYYILKVSFTLSKKVIKYFFLALSSQFIYIINCLLNHYIHLYHQSNSVSVAWAVEYTDCTSAQS